MYVLVNLRNIHQFEASALIVDFFERSRQQSFDGLH